VFVQAVISLGLLATLVLLAQQALVALTSAEAHHRALRRATERSTRVATEVARSVASSRRIFQDDAVGRLYLASLDLGARPLLPGARLPRFEAEATMGPDAPGAPRTGNVLLFAEEAGAVTCSVGGAPGAARRIDAFRLVCVYPHETGRRVLGTRPARDLVIWKSRLHPDHAQIMAVEDSAERLAVVRDLVTRLGCTHAWAAQEPPGSAFFALDAVGVVSPTPDPSLSLAEDPAASPGGRLVYGSWQLGRTDPAEAAYRPVFTVEPPSTWAPDGFEVKVAGPSAARSVWLRVVVEHGSGGVVGVHGTGLLVAAGRR
jgi:hypothetical protein